MLTLNENAPAVMRELVKPAEKIADLEIQVTALEYTELRVLSSMAHGGHHH